MSCIGELLDAADDLICAINDFSTSCERSELLDGMIRLSQQVREARKDLDYYSEGRMRSLESELEGEEQLPVEVNSTSDSDPARAVEIKISLEIDVIAECYERVHSTSCGKEKALKIGRYIKMNYDGKTSIFSYLERCCYDLKDDEMIDMLLLLGEFE